MPEALVVILLTLAVYRVTRLVVADSFPPVAAAREAIAERFGDGHPLAYLVTCPWCVSVYVAGGAVGLALLAGVSLPVPLFLWPAASAVCGLLTALDPAFDA